MVFQGFTTNSPVAQNTMGVFVRAVSSGDVNN